jgi:hypothetical protein
MKGEKISVSADFALVGHFANFAVTLRPWRVRAFNREDREG